jgi:hypothetical protein
MLRSNSALFIALLLLRAGAVCAFERWFAGGR